MSKEAKLWDLIKGVKIAMLTTHDRQRDLLRSRPLAALEVQPESADLWFLTALDSAKVGDIEDEWSVNLSFSDVERGVHVSVSGVAEMVSDREHIHRLWSPLQRAWFPNGPDDPNIGLLRVRVVAAEYWDNPSTLVGKAIALAGSIAKAVTTGEPAAVGGSNEKVTLDR